MKMTPTRLRAASRLKDAIDEAVTRAVNHHNNLLRPSLYDKYGVHDMFWHDGHVTSIQDTYVDVGWDEYARGCHTDSGEDRIPVEALCDDTYEEAIRKIVEAKLQGYANEQARKDEQKLDAKRAQLAALKAELGET